MPRTPGSTAEAGPSQGQGGAGGATGGTGGTTGGAAAAARAGPLGARADHGRRCRRRARDLSLDSAEHRGNADGHLAPEVRDGCTRRCKLGDTADVIRRVGASVVCLHGDALLCVRLRDSASGVERLFPPGGEISRARRQPPRPSARHSRKRATASWSTKRASASRATRSCGPAARSTAPRTSSARACATRPRFPHRCTTT